MPRSPSASAHYKPNDTLPKQFTGKLTDDIWYLRVASRGAVLSLPWSTIRLVDGSSLTDSQNEMLLTGAKVFLSCIAQGWGSTRARLPRSGTLYGYYVMLRQLIPWMSRRRLRSFAELTLPHVIGYRNYALRLVKSEKVPLNSSNRRAGGTYSRAQAADRVRVLLMLARVQHKMGLHSPNLSEIDVEDTLSCLKKRMQDSKRTERIPDGAFETLIQHSEHFLLSLDIGVIRRFFVERAALPTWTTPEQTSKRLRDFAAVTIQCGSWKQSLNTFSRRDARRLKRSIRAACFVLIAGLVGMRISEVLSLRGNCLKSRRTKDGRQLLELHGTLYKTADESEGVDAQWVAGWDTADNRVALAVTTLETLTSASEASYLFSRDNRVERIAQQTLQESLKEYLGFIEILRGVRIHTHQFRKTFAHFVALSNFRATVALMRHFKHVSSAMTGRYLPHDPEQINDIIEASEELVYEKLDVILSSEKLMGIKGEQIAKRNAHLRGPDGALARQRVIEEMKRSRDSRFLLHPYGVCIYDADFAACHGDLAKVGLGTCVGCSNHSIDETHMPFWVEFEGALDATISEQSKLGILNLDLIKQRDQARSVIRGLVESVS